MKEQKLMFRIAFAAFAAVMYTASVPAGSGGR